MPDVIRLGMVGLGKIARDQHIPAISADSGFALVATASPDGATAGVPAFPDLDSLLACGPALDAVALCTPPAVRAGLAERALAAGLHVMLEKPPALSADQAMPLQAHAAQAGRSLFAAWHSREAADVDAAAQWLANQAIRSAEVIWRESVDRWHPGQDWLLAEGGFGVFDPAINAFSILTHILPAPLEVARVMLGVPANRAAPAEARMILRCGGAKVDCDLSILEHGLQRWEIRITADGGKLTLSEGGHRLTIDGAAKPMVGEGEYPRLYRRFAELIATSRSDLDLAPLRLVDEALRLGEVCPLPSFHFAQPAA